MKKSVFLVCVVAVVVISAIVLTVKFAVEGTLMAGGNEKSFALVIDPGHGGLDGGANAEDGTFEKSINLEISKAIRAEAEAYGMRVTMLRNSDEGLYFEGSTSDRWTKMGDLMQRLKLIDEIQPNLVLSIHLNSFYQDRTVRGAQVFYPKFADKEQEEKNKQLAEQIQSDLNDNLDMGKDRIVLQKTNTYMFKKVKVPTVLIECGFLSNADDLKMLMDENFQKNLSKCVMKSIGKFYSISKKIDGRLELRDSLKKNNDEQKMWINRY